MTVNSFVEFYSTRPNVSWVLPVAYFCTTMCVYNYTTIRTHAFTCMLMHLCRFIYFKDAIPIAKLRVEIICDNGILTDTVCEC